MFSNILIDFTKKKLTYFFFNSTGGKKFGRQEHLRRHKRTVHERNPKPWDLPNTKSRGFMLDA